MTDVFWTGKLWHFDDISNIEKKNAPLTQAVDSGVCDAVYLNENRFIIVGDSGFVQMFEILPTDLDDVPAQLQSLSYTREHDSTALAVSLFPNKKDIVTAGMDYCIKIWSMEVLRVVHSFPFAHADIVTGVDVKPTCDNTIVSTGLDGAALLWDVRCKKAVHILSEKNDCPLTAVTWNPNVDHLVAIGSEEGNVILVDVRQADARSSHESIKCDRGVHKLLFNPNPEKQEQLACCFDNTIVNVFDSSRQLVEIYKDDNSHSDFVRGLAWHNDVLYSCAWDGDVNKHTVPSDFSTKILESKED